MANALNMLFRGLLVAALLITTLAAHRLDAHAVHAVAQPQHTHPAIDHGALCRGSTCCGACVFALVPQPNLPDVLALVLIRYDRPIPSALSGVEPYGVDPPPRCF